MDDLERVWLWYAEQRLGRQPAIDEVETLSAEQVQGLLWEFNSLFERRANALGGIVTGAADDVDGALCMLAQNDSFEGWDKLSDPIWRGLLDRHSRILMEVEVARRERVNIMLRIPRGLDHRSKMRTVWLQQMLAVGRRPRS